MSKTQTVTESGSVEEQMSFVGRINGDMAETLGKPQKYDMPKHTSGRYGVYGCAWNQVNNANYHPLGHVSTQIWPAWVSFRNANGLVGDYDQFLEWFKTFEYEPKGWSGETFTGQKGIDIAKERLTDHVADRFEMATGCPVTDEQKEHIAEMSRQFTENMVISTYKGLGVECLAIDKVAEVLGCDFELTDDHYSEKEGIDGFLLSDEGTFPVQVKPKGIVNENDIPLIWYEMEDGERDQGIDIFADFF